MQQVRARSETFEGRVAEMHSIYKKKGASYSSDSGGLNSDPEGGSWGSSDSDD